MHSFQAKTRWKRPRKSENKNYGSDPFLLNPFKGIQIKKAKKLKIIKKHHYGFFSGRNTMGNTEKE